MTAHTLDVSELAIQYQDRDQADRRILDAFTLRVEPGTFICISGRSGSGKSSLIRCIVGLQKPTSGTIAWNGELVSTMRADDLADLRRCRVAYVDQAASLVDELSVLENVVLPVVPDGHAAVRAATQRANGHLMKLGLGSLHAARPSMLSGGERQRTAIARALTTDVAAIVADEPTASLDRYWADTVIAQLREATHLGKTIIVASHDPGVANEADLVVTINDVTTTTEPVTRGD